MKQKKVNATLIDANEAEKSANTPSNNLIKQQPNKTHRTRLVILTVTCIVVTNTLLVFSSEDLRAVMIDLTAVITSGAALIACASAIGLGYLRKSVGSVHLWLLVGLIFWFAAEVTWAYTRQMLGIDLPYPSIADASWIAGYGFLAFYLYKIMRKITVTNPIDKSLVLLVSVAVSLLLGYVLNLTFGVAEILGFQEDVLGPIVSLSYPILDGILLVPSLVIIWSLRKGDPSTFNWVLMSMAFALLAIGDIGFGYNFALAPILAEETEWIWAIFYNAGYLCIAFSIIYLLTSDRRLSSNVERTKDILASP